LLRGRKLSMVGMGKWRSASGLRRSARRCDLLPEEARDDSGDDWGMRMGQVRRGG